MVPSYSTGSEETRNPLAQPARRIQAVLELMG